MQVEGVWRGRGGDDLRREHRQRHEQRQDHADQAGGHPPPLGRQGGDDRDEDGGNRQDQSDVEHRDAGGLQAGLIGARVVGQRETAAVSHAVDLDFHPQLARIGRAEGLGERAAQWDGDRIGSRGRDRGRGVDDRLGIGAVRSGVVHPDRDVHRRNALLRTRREGRLRTDVVADVEPIRALKCPVLVGVDLAPVGPEIVAAILHGRPGDRDGLSQHRPTHVPGHDPPVGARADQLDHMVGVERPVGPTGGRCRPSGAGPVMQCVSRVDVEDEDIAGVRLVGDHDATARIFGSGRGHLRVKQAFDNPE